MIPVTPTPLQESPVNLVRAAINPLRNTDETIRDGVPRWINGFAYMPTGNSQYGPIGPCETSVDLSRIQASPDIALWHPYIAWTAVQCAAFASESFDWYGRAEEQLTLARIKTLEHELWAGTLAQSDPLLVDNLWLAMPAVSTAVSGGGRGGASGVGFGPIDLTPGSGPPSVKRAFGILEQAIADWGVGARGMIHARPEAVPDFTNVRREGSLLLTHNDTVVVPGNGYANLGPGGSVPADGTTWLYATSQIEVRIDSQIKLIPDPTDDPDWKRHAMDTRVNLLTVRAEQFVVASWDGQVHFAVRATLPT